MKRKFKPTWDNLHPKQINFSITIENYLELLQEATRAKMTIADLLRKKLGYDTLKELKEKRLTRNNNSYFNH
jgi:hypothetical protein